ncbi:hypothetical protein FZEAL_281 [Fusarium zealandicum]|uniref:DUF2423 domain-containing protein n=1 Tax=Fusarium zealandicum TaxID=1053134 RepID=A0A8H4UVQ2_9HYPO|nr:hypothetical protein FZEAL_281 [Fusarium zealandicum]
MAKSSRSSTRKANNRRLVANVFGPVEDARAQRLSARLLELAKQPKPESSDVKMNIQDEDVDANSKDNAQEEETTMEVDSVKPSSGRIEKIRIDKRKQKKSKIIFPKYGDRQKKKRT